jgi:hypothetical protein
MSKEIDDYEFLECREEPGEIPGYFLSVLEEQGKLGNTNPIEKKDAKSIKNFELEVSSTLIKDLMENGTEKEYCPNYIYNKWILGKDVFKVSDDMDKGSYGETMLLGGSARGKSMDDLPRLKNSNKSKDQQRIDMQVIRAKQKIAKHNIAIYPGDNTQVLIFKEINGVMCRGEFDIFPTPFMKYIYDKSNNVIDSLLGIAIIDVKFTGNLESTFGPNGGGSWGNFELMDHTQAIMYLELVRDIDWELNKHISPELREIINATKDKDIWFYYWVFDFKRDESLIDDKLFEVIWTPDKQAEIKERIRKVKSIFDYHFEMRDWENCIPNQINCRKCTIDCNFRNQIQSI